METMLTYFTEIADKFGAGLAVPILLLLFVGILAQWALYDKCGLPGIACLVPFWNVTTFLKIMGRPWWQIFYFLIPVYNIYFTIRVYIELCQCFGRYKALDYIAVIVFNGFYILNLGLSYSAKYRGPVYKTDLSKQPAAKAGTRSKKQGKVAVA